MTSSERLALKVLIDQRRRELAEVTVARKRDACDHCGAALGPKHFRFCSRACRNQKVAAENTKYATREERLEARRAAFRRSYERRKLAVA